MAWDEWEQLKAAALARQQKRMRLDSVPAEGGGTGGEVGAAGAGAPDLRTNKPGKQAAVKALREEIRPDTDTAGDHAAEPSSDAVREFSGWATGSGLKDALAEWELQVKNLKGRLGADQAALEQSHQEFQYVDYGVRSRIAQIDAGPDVPESGPQV